MGQAAQGNHPGVHFGERLVEERSIVLASPNQFRGQTHPLQNRHAQIQAAHFVAIGRGHVAGVDQAQFGSGNAMLAAKLIVAWCGRKQRFVVARPEDQLPRRTRGELHQAIDQCRDAGGAGQERTKVMGVGQAVADQLGEPAGFETGQLVEGRPEVACGDQRFVVLQMHDVGERRRRGELLRELANVFARSPHVQHGAARSQRGGGFGEPAAQIGERSRREQRLPELERGRGIKGNEHRDLVATTHQMVREAVQLRAAVAAETVVAGENDVQRPAHQARMR